MQYIVTAIIMTLFFGCVPYSDNPLTEQGSSQVDSSILGTWYWEKNDENGYVHIGLSEQAKLINLCVVEFNNKTTIKIVEFSGYTSTFGKLTYLNIKVDNDSQNEPLPHFILLKYLLEGESLGIATMETSVIQNAIKVGNLAGVVSENWLPVVHITEEQEKLRKFIIQKDSDLFPEIMFMSKVKPSPPRQKTL